MATSNQETPARLSSDSITTSAAAREHEPSRRSESPSPERKVDSGRRVGSSFLFPSGERAKSWQDSYLFELLGERGAQMYETTEKGQNVQVSDIEEVTKAQEEQQRAHMPIVEGACALAHGWSELPAGPARRGRRVGGAVVFAMDSVPRVGGRCLGYR